MKVMSGNSTKAVVNQNTKPLKGMKESRKVFLIKISITTSRLRMEAAK